MDRQVARRSCRAAWRPRCQSGQTLLPLALMARSVVVMADRVKSSSPLESGVIRESDQYSMWIFRRIRGSLTLSHTSSDESRWSPIVGKYLHSVKSLCFALGSLSSPGLSYRCVVMALATLPLPPPTHPCDIPWLRSATHSTSRRCRDTRRRARASALQRLLLCTKIRRAQLLPRMQNVYTASGCQAFGPRDVMKAQCFLIGYCNEPAARTVVSQLLTLRALNVVVSPAQSLTRNALRSFAPTPRARGYMRNPSYPSRDTGTRRARCRLSISVSRRLWRDLLSSPLHRSRLRLARTSRRRSDSSAP
ncbi:hypothetical protein EXIGLDRAFT_516087 [Exidia glandulosa HHB12029]|uniref:Uncharacterized protein n=1 Tax=Exidia glandulosa HHB12029 TaxID=1314781 RepID=A0A165J9X1_EXIGL|nr:hypothetical protein EXIGLDRAFT_516087 [Exidia glandulosa HHB12029]